MLVAFRHVEYFVEDVPTIQERRSHALVRRSIFKGVKVVRLFTYAVKIKALIIVTNVVFIHVRNLRTFLNGG